MKLSTGQEIHLRGLTWREVRHLKEQGYSLAHHPEDHLEEIVEAVMLTVFSDLDLGRLLVREVFYL